MGPTGGKYLIKIICDIKIEIEIFEILVVPNSNKFWDAFNFGTNMGPTGGKYFLKIVFDIEIEIGVL